MQQVKKQLQDAIAELKSGWGINEVKREDLAAVLEKVVAALDRAAQLPVAPARPKYVGGVIVAVKKFDDEGLNIEDGNAPSDSILTLYGKRGENTAQILMFCPSNRRLYRHTNNGNIVYNEYKDYVILCDSSIMTFEHDTNGTASYIRETGTNVYNHI